MKKRILVALLALALIVSLGLSAFAAVRLGDVDGDFLDPELAAYLREVADRVVLEGEMPNW